MLSYNSDMSHSHGLVVIVYGSDWHKEKVALPTLYHE